MAGQRGERSVLAMLALGALAVYAAGVAGKVLLDGLAVADAVGSAEAVAAVAGWMLVSPALIVFARRRRRSE